MLKSSSSWSSFLTGSGAFSTFAGLSSFFFSAGLLAGAEPEEAPTLEKPFDINFMDGWVLGRDPCP